MKACKKGIKKQKKNTLIRFSIHYQGGTVSMVMQSIKTRAMVLFKMLYLTSKLTIAKGELQGAKTNRIDTLGIFWGLGCVA